MAKITDRLGLFGVLLVALFLTVTALFDFSSINIFATTLNISISVAVAYAYRVEAWQAMRAGIPTRADRLALGIFVAWTANAGQRVISLVYRVQNDASWLSTPYVNFLFFMTCVAATLHLTAPQATNPAPIIKRQAALWVSLAVGAGLAGFVLGLRWHSL